MSEFETAIHREPSLVLKDFLFPDETVKYRSPDKVSHLGDRFYFYITNKRILVHRSKGKVFKKDRVIAERLENVKTLSYNEKGIMRKKAVLSVQTESKRIFFEGKIPDVKDIWQELQKHVKGGTTTMGRRPRLSYARKRERKKPSRYLTLALRRALPWTDA